MALANTLISEANFLLLDEPTNHLDFIREHSDTGVAAIQRKFCVVSHNRHFVSQVANKIWYIEDKQIKEYPGTFDEYEYWRKKKAERANEPPKQEKKVNQLPNQSRGTNYQEAKLKSLERDLKN